MIEIMHTIEHQDPKIQLTQGQKTSGHDDPAHKGAIRAAIIGPVSSGRKEQATMLANKYCVCHLTPEEMLDKEIASGSELGKIVQEYKKYRITVPEKVMMKVLENNLERPECNHGYLFDGFPRTLQEAKDVDEVLEKHHLPLDAVIELNKGRKWIFDKVFTPREQVGQHYSHIGLRAQIDANKPFSEVIQKVDQVFDNYVKHHQTELESTM